MVVINGQRFRRKINERIRAAIYELEGVELIRSSDWQEDAACRRVDPNIFVPDRTNEVIESLARSYCDRCPVRVPCLIDGLTSKVGGMWGGLSEPERDTLRRYLHRQQEAS